MISEFSNFSFGFTAEGILYTANDNQDAENPKQKEILSEKGKEQLFKVPNSKMKSKEPMT